VSFPVIEGTRFEPFRLNELFDYQRYVVVKFFEDCKTAREVAEKVIRAVQYPLYMGQADDEHCANWFHGKFCRCITDDYWAMNSECALCGWGDCEDSSMLVVGGARLKGVPPENVYEVFGVVRDASTGEVLGGHGWVVIRDASFGTDKYVLVESTLDTPPPRYPEVGSTLEDLKKPFAWEGVVYEPEQLFNDVIYVEIRPLTTRRGRKERERLEKYSAIERAWGIETKFTKALRRSRLYRIKRALRLAR
jgi:hypothetical protein